jgi:hypothetical protein
MRIAPAPRVRAGMVFIGYGLSVPEAGYDDLAGQDLRGKIAVFFSGGPESIPGPLLAHYQTAAERWRALKRAGAIGTVTISNPRGQDIPWERSKLARLLPAMSLADPAFDETAGQQIGVTVNPERAAAWFEGSGQYKDSMSPSWEMICVAWLGRWVWRSWRIQSRSATPSRAAINTASFAAVFPRCR